MSRFVSKGRADPWAIAPPRRCHDRNIYGPLIGMDYGSSSYRGWAILGLAILAGVMVI